MYLKKKLLISAIRFLRLIKEIRNRHYCNYMMVTLVSVQIFQLLLTKAQRTRGEFNYYIRGMNLSEYIVNTTFYVIILFSNLPTSTCIIG